MSSRVCHGVCGCEVSRGVSRYVPMPGIRLSIYVESPWSDSAKDLKTGPHRHCIQRHSFESAMMMNRKNACRSVSGTGPMFRNYFFSPVFVLGFGAAPSGSAAHSGIQTQEGTPLPSRLPR